MSIHQQQLPPITKCPRCFNAERTTACRFCGISKITPYHEPDLLLIDFKEDDHDGTVSCTFRTTWNGKRITVSAVLGYPDPDVGLVDPYPINVTAFDEIGRRIELDYKQARAICVPAFDRIAGDWQTDFSH